MLIGVPKEIKNNENRVGLIPASVKEIVRHGHRVLVEENAGQGIGKTNEDYVQAGAEIVQHASEIFSRAEMIIKVKEPQPVEYKMLNPNQILFTYLHLAPDVNQTDGLIDSGCIAIAYETVTSPYGGLPLLAPMSEVAGRMAIQVGAYHLQKSNGGLGALLGGVPGVPPANVVILGGGVAGLNAIKMAVGMAANVVVIDKDIQRLRYLDDLYQGRIKTVFSTAHTVDLHCAEADLVVGTVLIPGANAPKLITLDLLERMKFGAVIVDVAIDQGGCTEASKATTHESPTFISHGIVMYCVANMPGGVPLTSTYALNNATLPFVLSIADQGVKTALLSNKHLLDGLNVCQGKLTYQEISKAQGRAFVEPLQAVKAI